MRRRYKWYVMKNQETSLEHEKIKDAVYKTILSIEEMADAENPTLIKDNHRTPEEKAEASVKQEETKVKKAHKLPADSILYFDIDSDGFRSFKKDKLVSFEK